MIISGQGQICEHNFVPNGGYRVNYPSNIFCITLDFENWVISLGFSPDLAREYSVT